eukprot:TRINITY_DN9060_c0_g1_i1.p1 TRINITY_DN9060_c0_g1~~TRINITY_DN9060_c0_g1_i1.p1  ORF type:complete len:604 (-),score=20.41 TRINITY_DN9060_c0_g1_i1:79-1890(-)
MGWARSFWTWFFRTVLHIFFRDIQIVGQHHIPATGPVIFVGNHQNQFLDGMMLLVTCHRNVSFLVAAKSLARPLVGFFARQLDSIPVERAQDSSLKGLGTLQVEENALEPPCTLFGMGTRFTEQVTPGDSIFVEGHETGRVSCVVSDTELVLDTVFAKPLPPYISLAYRIYKKTDQTGLYKAVWQALGKQKCIGIFPEGGSHDRSELLPLKAGVAIMALGARDKFEHDIRIVPCGLNYFSGHRFRSRVIVEFGEPVLVTTDQNLDGWRSKDSRVRREACNALLADITDSLHGVTINASDYETLETIYAIRRLYQPSNLKLEPAQYLALTRRFAQGYTKLKDNPHVIPVLENVRAYTSTLTALGLKDYQVEGIAPSESSGQKRSPIDARELYRLGMWRFFVALSMWVLAFPGAILNLPVAAFAKRMAERKAEEALKASNVKITGRDVIASYKVLIGFVLLPIFYTFYASVAYWLSQSFFVAFCVFLVLPFFSYATVRVGEEGALEILQIRSLFTIKRSEDKLFALRAWRDELKSSIRNLVDKLGPVVDKQFEETRIIGKEAFEGEPQKERLADKLDPRTQHYLTRPRKRKISFSLSSDFDLPNS